MSVKSRVFGSEWAVHELAAAARTETITADTDILIRTVSKLRRNKSAANNNPGSEDGREDGL